MVQAKWAKTTLSRHKIQQMVFTISCTNAHDKSIYLHSQSHRVVKRQYQRGIERQKLQFKCNNFHRVYRNYYTHLHSINLHIFLAHFSFARNFHLYLEIPDVMLDVVVYFFVRVTMHLTGNSIASFICDAILAIFRFTLDLVVVSLSATALHILGRANS